MALEIRHTDTVTGKQAEAVLRSMAERDGYGQDELDFSFNKKEFLKRLADVQFQCIHSAPKK